jgi:hypothetical protein
MVRPIPVLANMNSSVEMVAGACIETSAEAEFFVLEIPRKHRAS